MSQTDFYSGSGTFSQTPFQPQYNTPRTAQQAYDDVLAYAGAVPRDSTDRRVVREVKTGTGSLRQLSSQEINSRELIPRQPLVLPKWQKPTDADNDGMADAWESMHGLDPTDATDFSKEMNGGYEAIEVYINELSDTLVATGRWPAYLTALENLPSGPRSIAFSAVPSPFRAQTDLVVTGAFNHKSKVALQILDLNGRIIKKVSNQMLKIENGAVRYSWAPQNRPSGIYIAHIKIQDRTLTKPLFLLK
jgi:hypothetical protein